MKYSILKSKYGNYGKVGCYLISATASCIVGLLFTLKFAAMKSTATLKMMCIIIILCTLNGCKKTVYGNDFYSIADSASVNPTADTINRSLPDTSSILTPGTPVDTLAEAQPNQTKP
jgi:hypothetical protein